MNKITPLFSLGAVTRNSARIERAHFDPQLAAAPAQELFRRHVELIEVETTSYCNRTCSFCPNSLINRRSEKLAMPEPVWHALVQGLQAVDFGGTLVWSRYSEPLSEARLVERLREVKGAAPRCRVAVNSNGDFLKPELLQALEQAGLNRLWVDIYLPDEDTYDLEKARSYTAKFLERIQRQGTEVAQEPELTYAIQSSMDMFCIVRNSASMKRIDMSDRGGLMKQARLAKRVAPCYAPFKHLVIDWDGSVVICCQVRSDAVKHAGTVVGRLGENGLDLVSAYVRLAGWREHLQGYGRKKGPCATCNVSEYHTNPLTRLLSATALPGGAVNGLVRRALRPFFAKRERL